MKIEKIEKVVLTDEEEKIWYDFRGLIDEIIQNSEIDLELYECAYDISCSLRDLSTLIE